MSTLALIVLSAFAAIGIFYFVSIVMELLFSPDIKKIVTVVPVASKDLPLDEIMSAVNNISAGNITVIVDMCGGLDDTAQYIEKGLCAAVTKPDDLGEVLCGIIR